MGVHENWHSFLKRVHDWFRSGLDKMIEDADSVSPSHIQKLGFAAVSLTRNLRHHHELEEAFVFPFFSKKVDISHWATAHEELIETLDLLQSQGNSVYKDPATYDAVRFKATIEELKRIVLPHFADEERISLPENTRTLWTEEEFRKLHA